MALFIGTITLSGNLDYFENQGAYFVYHNLFGYILEMSRDIIDFLEYFRGEQRTPEEVAKNFRGTYDSETLEQFVEVFMNQGCLVPKWKSEEEVAVSMVPVHARWAVYHMAAGEPVTLYSAHRDQALVDVIELDSWDSAFWRVVDGEKSVEAIVEELKDHPDSPTVGLEQKALATLAKLTHCSAQFLKLSPQAMSAFGKGHNARPMPPYLKSTMPYRRVTDEIRGDKGVHVGFDQVVSVAVSGASFDREGFESTLAHLFRHRHPALRDRSYGGALAHRLAETGHMVVGARILEAGALSADLILGLLEEVQASWPDVYGTLHVTLLAPEQSLVGTIETAIEAAGHAATVVAGSIVELGGLDGPFDVVLSDEYMANFETTLLRKVALGDDDDDDDDEARPALLDDLDLATEAAAESEAAELEPEPAAAEPELEPAAAEPPTSEEVEAQSEPAADAEPAKKRNGRSRNRDIYLGQGDSVSVVFKHNLTFHDMDGEFLFNIGAVNFVDAVADALEPGGIAILIEYGELFDYPVPSTSEETEQYSIRFQTLQEVAKSRKLRNEFDWIVNYLGFDTARQMLTTTQHQFKALKVLLEEHGLSLDNRAYSKDEWLALLASGDVEASALPELEFRSLNDRVMGLVPAGVKVIELRRPTDGESEGE